MIPRLIFAFLLFYHHVMVPYNIVCYCYDLEMEECSWIEAAVKVLVHAEQPMHYADIKRVILEMGLVPAK